jgi:predicted MarR family transcription regulator
MASPPHRKPARSKMSQDKPSQSKPSPSKPSPREASAQTSAHTWHLAEDATGIAMADLEYAILRVFEAFGRWQSECLAAVSGATITGPENVLLHVIGMKDRPKTIHDIQLLTNRTDTPNVQYGLRKLIKLGFIEKQGSGRAGVFYRCTPKGVQICRTYADLRKKLLLKSVKALPKFEAESIKTTAHLEAIEKVYASASREAATFFRR